MILAELLQLQNKQLFNGDYGNSVFQLTSGAGRWQIGNALEQDADGMGLTPIGGIKLTQLFLASSKGNIAKLIIGSAEKTDHHSPMNSLTTCRLLAMKLWIGAGP